MRTREATGPRFLCGSLFGFSPKISPSSECSGAVVTTGGEGSNLGLARSGQHPVISRVGQHLGNTAALSPRRVLAQTHTAAHWNPSPSASSKYISTNSTTNTSLSGPKTWATGNRDVAGK